MSSSSSERPYQTKLRLEREAIHEFVDRDSTGIVMQYLPLTPLIETYIKFECCLIELYSIRQDIVFWERHAVKITLKRLLCNHNGRFSFTHEYRCAFCKFRNASLHGHLKGLTRNLKRTLLRFHKIQFY
jgi:hypothetical protein